MKLIAGLGRKGAALATVEGELNQTRVDCASMFRHCMSVNNSFATLRQICSFRAIGERLGTAGQPSEDQFRMLREAGFEVVINLALPTSDNALPNEGSIVTGLGMSYVHIPVDFTAPASADFRAFCGVMAALDDRHVFVHCAANKRVSAFVFLNRVLHQGVGITDAREDLHAIWEPDDVWRRFIQNQLGGGEKAP